VNAGQTQELGACWGAAKLAGSGAKGAEDLGAGKHKELGKRRSLSRINSEIKHGKEYNPTPDLKRFRPTYHYMLKGCYLLNILLLNPAPK
jgi:hypothetical protein